MKNAATGKMSPTELGPLRAPEHSPEFQLSPSIAHYATPAPMMERQSHATSSLPVLPAPATSPAQGKANASNRWLLTAHWVALKHGQSNPAVVLAARPLAPETPPIGPEIAEERPKPAVVPPVESPGKTHLLPMLTAWIAVLRVCFVQHRHII